MQDLNRRKINTSLLDAARSYDLELAVRFIKKTKGPLGYIRLPNSIGNEESRDMMMCTFLFSALGRKFDHIVEIGGGFGNWTRLCDDIIKFKKWTIIDLPHVVKLQKEFLKKELKKNYNKMEFIDTKEYRDWKVDFKEADLVIGSHSLSEFNYSTFEDYYDNIVKKGKYLFWAANKRDPLEELVALKLKDINKDFSLIESLYTEEGRIMNIIFKNE
jgi:hypothetical protein